MNLSLVDEVGRSLEAKPGPSQLYSHTGDVQYLVETLEMDLPDLQVVAVSGEPLLTSIHFNTCIICSTLHDVPRIEHGRVVSRSSKLTTSQNERLLEKGMASGR